MEIKIYELTNEPGTFFIEDKNHLADPDDKYAYAFVETKFSALMAYAQKTGKRGYIDLEAETVVDPEFGVCHKYIIPSI